MKFFATPPVHGSLARYVDHPEDFCFALPAEVSYEEGAMIEPLSNGIHACRRAGVQPGKSIAILGAGPMGERWGYYDIYEIYCSTDLRYSRLSIITQGLMMVNDKNQTALS